MSNQEILEKAIQKAIDGGFATESCGSNLYDENGNIVEEVLIFNHHFAKALWGEETIDLDTYRSMETPRDIYPWKHHLMRMVIAPDPIQYLGENI